MVCVTLVFVHTQCSAESVGITVVSLLPVVAANVVIRMWLYKQFTQTFGVR